ncbi:MAG: transaldolase [Chloroflexi bacterium]|nr:transaldolase [Chloroflexota bacterium]
MTKLHELHQHGQAVWLDFISRDLIESGELDRLIGQGLRGMTSNPKIFDQAISEGDAYNAQLADLAQEGSEPLDAYEAIAIKDIQAAADKLHSVYNETNGRDGYVSLEVNPHLAYETEATIAEVRRLHDRVDRQNVMFKVPATPHGVVAVRRLTRLGININITLMFTLSHYNAVAQAYIDGLEACHQNGGDVSKVASVASFFVSRVDAKLDPMLEEAGAQHLKGKIAIANAKTVYKRFQQMFSGERWAALAAAGAQVQRPLWASTSTKDPAYSDTLYVDSLIGSDTVNTMPPETLQAFLDHGTVAQTIDRNVEEADVQLNQLVQYGIELLEVGDELQREGVEKFIKPFDALLATITQHARATS